MSNLVMRSSRRIHIRSVPFWPSSARRTMSRLLCSTLATKHPWHSGEFRHTYIVFGFRKKVGGRRTPVSWMKVQIVSVHSEPDLRPSHFLLFVQLRHLFKSPESDAGRFIPTMCVFPCDQTSVSDKLWMRTGCVIQVTGQQGNTCCCGVLRLERSGRPTKSWMLSLWHC